MKIKVGIWKEKKLTKAKKENINKNTEIISYEVKKFNKAGFKTRLMKQRFHINNKIGKIKDADIFVVGTDLIYKRKQYMGGCKISGAVIKDTRVSVLELACGQLIRQIKATLEGIK